MPGMERTQQTESLHLNEKWVKLHHYRLERKYEDDYSIEVSHDILKLEVIPHVKSILFNTYICRLER